MPDSDDEEEQDIDSYKRPSASNPKPIKKASLPLSDNNDSLDNSGLDLKNSMSNPVVNRNNSNQPGKSYQTVVKSYKK